MVGYVKKVRSKLMLIQVRFAQLFGVHPITVSKWERGILRPSSYQIALMQAFARAAERKPDVGPMVAERLARAGVVSAIYLLLRTAMEVSNDGKD